MLPYLSKHNKVEGFYFSSGASYQQKPTSIINHPGIQASSQKYLNQDKNHETQTNSNNSQEVRRSTEAFQPYAKTNEYGIVNQKPYGSYSSMNQYGSDLQLGSQKQKGEENIFKPKSKYQNRHNHYGQSGYNPETKHSQSTLEKCHKFISLLDSFLSVKIKCSKFDVFDFIQNAARDNSRKVREKQRKIFTFQTIIHQILTRKYHSVFMKLQFNSMDHSEVEKKDDEFDKDSDARTYMKHFTKIDMLAEYMADSGYSQGDNCFQSKQGTEKDFEIQPKAMSETQNSPEQEKQKKRMFHFNTNLRRKNFDVFNNYGFGGGDLFKQHRMKKQRSQQFLPSGHSEKKSHDSSFRIAPASLNKSFWNKQTQPFRVCYKVETKLQQQPFLYESSHHRRPGFEKRKVIFQLQKQSFGENSPDPAASPMKKYDIFEKIPRFVKEKKHKEREVQNEKKERDKQYYKKIEERIMIQRLLREKNEQIYRIRKERQKSEESRSEKTESRLSFQRQKVGTVKSIQKLDHYIKNVDSVIEKKTISKEPSIQKKDGLNSEERSGQDYEREERRKKMQLKKKLAIQAETLRSSLSNSKQLLKEESNMNKLEVEKPRSISSMLTQTREKYGIPETRENRMQNEPTKMYQRTAAYQTPYEKYHQEREKSNLPYKGYEERLLENPSRRQASPPGKVRVNSCVPKYTHSPSPPHYHPPHQDEVKVYFTISSPTHEDKPIGNNLPKSPSHDYASRRKINYRSPPSITQYYANLAKNNTPTEHPTNPKPPQFSSPQPISPQYNPKPNHYYSPTSPQQSPKLEDSTPFRSPSHKKIKVISTRHKH